MEESPSILQEILTTRTKQLLFVNDNLDSCHERRRNERIPIMNVYCFCESEEHRNVISLLFRPCLIVLLNVAPRIFSPGTPFPVEAAAGASYARTMGHVDESLLLLAFGDRVDVVVVHEDGHEHDSVDTLMIGCRKDTDRRNEQMYDFVERHIREWVLRHMKSDQDFEIFIGGSNASALLECLKRDKAATVRALEWNNAIHVKGPDDICYVVKLTIHETIHFEGLNQRLLAETETEHVVIGCGIRRVFGDTYFLGYVSSIFPNPDDKEGYMYGIVYEDGDVEDCFAEDLLGKF